MVVKLAAGRGDMNPLPGRQAWVVRELAHILIVWRILQCNEIVGLYKYWGVTRLQIKRAAGDKSIKAFQIDAYRFVLF